MAMTRNTYFVTTTGMMTQKWPGSEFLLYCVRAFRLSIPQNHALRCLKAEDITELPPVDDDGRIPFSFEIPSNPRLARVFASTSNHEGKHISKVADWTSIVPQEEVLTPNQLKSMELFYKWLEDQYAAEKQAEINKAWEIHHAS